MKVILEESLGFGFGMAFYFGLFYPYLTSGR